MWSVSSNESSGNINSFLTVELSLMPFSVGSTYAPKKGVSKVTFKIPSNDRYTTINIQRHPKNTDGFRGTRILRFCMCVWGTKVLIPECGIFHQYRIFHWIFGRSKIFFLLLNFHSRIFYLHHHVMPCHVEFQLTTIIHQKTNTPRRPAHKNYPSLQ